MIIFDRNEVTYLTMPLMNLPKPYNIPNTDVMIKLIFESITIGFLQGNGRVSISPVWESFMKKFAAIKFLSFKSTPTRNTIIVTAVTK